MDFISLLAGDERELEGLFALARGHRPPGIEVRFDRIEPSLETLDRLRRHYPGFLLATSRRAGRVAIQRRAVEAGFDGIDLDHRRLVREGLPAWLEGRVPPVVVIASFHDDARTPSDAVLERWRGRLSAWGIPKLAVTPTDGADVVRVCALAAAWRRRGERFILTTMGAMAAASRVLLPLLGSEACYLAVDAEHVTAPGQLGWVVYRSIRRALRLREGGLVRARRPLTKATGASRRRVAGATSE